MKRNGHTVLNARTALAAAKRNGNSALLTPNSPLADAASLSASPGYASAAPSITAAGLNIGTVVDTWNHWREYYNPLRALDLQRYIALYDQSRRGLNAELQNVYREMEQLFPVLIGLMKRRTSQLVTRNFTAQTIDEKELPPGATMAQAEEQATCLRQNIAAVKNWRQAIKKSFGGTFRGWAHLEKIYKFPGTTDWTISQFEFVEQWHWTRKSMYAQWEYIPAATQSNSGLPVNEDQFVIYQADFALDRLALILFIRANLCEKDADALVSIYGIPRPGVIMPPNVPKEMEPLYLSAVKSFANGGAAALPNGTTIVPQPLGDLKGDIFKQRIDHINEMLVLAGTGGRLAMLTANTGMGGDKQGDEHADAFDEIGQEDAADLTECFQTQYADPILDREYPGDPHLAYLQLAAPEQTDTTQAVADILALSQAGYQVPIEQVQDQTGYQVTLKPQPSDPSDPSAPSDGDDDDEEVTNRATSAISSLAIGDALSASAARQLAEAIQSDMAHPAAKLNAALQIADDDLRAAKLKELLAQWPGIMADALLAPAATDVIENTIATAYAAGLQDTGTVTNRAAMVLNDDTAGEARDEQGRWTSADVGTGHVKLRGSSVLKESDRAVHVQLQTDEGSDKVWLPKSQTSVNEKGEVHASPWIIGQKEQEMADRNRYDIEHGQPRILTGDEPPPKTEEQKAREKSDNEAAWRKADETVAKRQAASDKRREASHAKKSAAAEKRKADDEARGYPITGNSHLDEQAKAAWEAKQPK